MNKHTPALSRMRDEFAAKGWNPDDLTKFKMLAEAPAVDPFLQFAREESFPVLIGSLAAGRTGGTAQDRLTFNPNQIPSASAWVSSIDVQFSIPVVLTVAAGKTATMSPLAPYSALSAQMVLAGSPEWPVNTSLVPFYLDEVTSRATGFDPYKAGPALVTTNQLPGDLPGQFYGGGSAPTFAGGSNTILPGGTTAGGGGGVTKNIIIRGTVRIQLQRLRGKTWGMIPIGDPQNVPQFIVTLNSLVGTNPENNMFIQDTSGSGVTAAVDTGGVVVNAIFNTRSIDSLPAGVQALPQPVVGLGLNLTYDNSWTFATANNVQYYKHQVAMIYTAIHHVLCNGAATVPIDADYFGLWLTNQATSARWYYDNSVGNYQDYFADVLRRYGRYLPKGHFIADLANGDFPDFPKETPYNGLMSPDKKLADAIGVAPTPNMATALRVPNGVTPSNCYAATYAFGLVPVPY